MKNEKSNSAQDKWQDFFEAWTANEPIRRNYCTGKRPLFKERAHWNKKFNPLIPSKAREMSPREREARNKWQMICEDWEKSGLSGQKYCKKKRIHEADFYKWRKKIAFPIVARPKIIPPHHWREIIKDWEISGLSVRRYCKEKNLSCTGLYKWRSKMKHPACLDLPGRVTKWRDIIKDWEASGLSMGAYSRRNTLSPSMVHYWDKKFNSHKPKQTLQQKALEKWTRVFEDFKKSGLSGFAYCQRHRVGTSSFYKWKRILNYSDPQLGLNLIKQERPKIALEDYFVSIPFGSAILMGSPLSSTKIDIMLSQGHRLHIAGQVNWKGLNAWLALLSQSKPSKEKEV